MLQLHQSDKLPQLSLAKFLIVFQLWKPPQHAELLGLMIGERQRLECLNVRFLQ